MAFKITAISIIINTSWLQIGLLFFLMEDDHLPWPTSSLTGHQTEGLSALLLCEQWKVHISMKLWDVLPKILQDIYGWTRHTAQEKSEHRILPVLLWKCTAVSYKKEAFLGWMSSHPKRRYKCLNPLLRTRQKAKYWTQQQTSKIQT